MKHICPLRTSGTERARNCYEMRRPAFLYFLQKCIRLTLERNEITTSLLQNYHKHITWRIRGYGNEYFTFSLIYNTELSLFGIQN
jgi:hypothetical protein